MQNKCPNCQQESYDPWKPFCSKRCKDIDLGRWFLESYRIPSEETIDPYQGEERDKLN